ncbi:unnamed protein product [Sphagnum troendelagicum]|uniref:Solute carrier family 35 member F2 n=1 Tax=Sphagnum troendelagicum TaxID=128251 RepID=A0ABP0TZQ2_9BRYO
MAMDEEEVEEPNLDSRRNQSFMEICRLKLMEHITGTGLKALLLGQFLSLIIAGGGFSSAVMARNGIDAPTTQCFLFFLLLTTVYGSIFLYRKKQSQISAWVYLLLAFLEVQANSLYMKAYQYTSITSAMLLDCWAIPLVLFLTWLALKTRYAAGHFVGVAICVLGLVVVIFSDVHAQDRSSGGSNIILGDILVLLAATLYAIMNVSEEFVVKSTGDQVEYLAYIGFFGALISVGQIYLLEWEGLQSIHWTVNSISALVGSAFTSFWFATFLPLLLRMSGSTMMNLSLLTSDMWAVAIQALIFAQVVDNLYFIAFGTVAAGLIVYAIAGDLSNDPLLGRGGASSALVHHEDYKYTRIEQLQREVTTEPAEVEEPLLQSR